MKKNIVPLLVGLLLLSACGGSVKDPSFTLEGTLTDSNFEEKTVYMKDAIKGTVKYDSVRVSHGKFIFTGRQDTAIVRELYVQLNDSDNYPLTVPVVLEPGEIRVKMGDVVSVSNTPLNDNLMEFLLAKDQFLDKDFSGKELADIKKEFSDLLVTWIVRNSGSNAPIGRYIYDSYGYKLDEQQKAQISKTMGW